MSIPRATVRLQFNADFTLDDAVKQVDYFQALGISHVYASPIQTARADSTHGYDIVDPATVSGVIGGEAALKRLVSALRAVGMGLILDIVPNHMGVSGCDNAWWRDILENGPESAYAHYFDIDWHSPDPVLRGKSLQPFLGDRYGAILSRNELKLLYDDRFEKLMVGYWDNRFPVAPDTYLEVLSCICSTGGASLPDMAGLDRVRLLFSEAAGQEGESRRHALRAGCDAFAQWIKTSGAAMSDAEDNNEEGSNSALQRALNAAYVGATNRTRLHALLEQQNYRLSWWRNGAEEINWRRFFEVTDLIGVRVEDPAVLEATHALIFRLYGSGLIDGVRIDHVDGLADPGGYCRFMRKKLVALAANRPGELANDTPYIVVEKILSDGETMRTDWGLDGGTGYSFMNEVGALLHNADGELPLSALWVELTGSVIAFEQQVRAARRRMLLHNLAAEFNTVCRLLHQVARSDLHTRDYTLIAIRRVLSELLVHFPVYRTYVGPDGRDEIDQHWFGMAMERATRTVNDADLPLLEQIADWLGGDAPGLYEPEEEALRMLAITRFQQLTPPLTAKSVEDTAFYRYGRLISRNEVGADPSMMAIGPGLFHAGCSFRVQHFPHNMLATATHDHKRGEDARARLAVLSEWPERWATLVRAWHLRHRPQRQAFAGIGNAPGTGDELMLYQTVVGAWPIGLAPDDTTGVAELTERLSVWQTKALREAKQRTDWVLPDEVYEKACDDFLRSLMQEPQFLREIAECVSALQPAAYVNSLSQTLIRLTSPGVPDLYQGTDLWDFTLVDPDNRRPVDYAQRRQLFASHAAVSSGWSLSGIETAAPKQQLIALVLRFRSQYPALFAQGSYLPVQFEGARKDHLIAYVRTDAKRACLVVTTILPARLNHDWTSGADFDWGNTRLILPEGAGNWAGAIWQSILGMPDFAGAGDQQGYLVSALLADKPLGVWTAEQN